MEPVYNIASASKQNDVVRGDSTATVVMEPVYYNMSPGRDMKSKECDYTSMSSNQAFHTAVEACEKRHMYHRCPTCNAANDSDSICCGAGAETQRECSSTTWSPTAKWSSISTRRRCTRHFLLKTVAEVPIEKSISHLQKTHPEPQNLNLLRILGIGTSVAI